MSTVEITKKITEASPRLMPLLVGAYYLITILTGVFVLFFQSRSALAADLIAGGFYLVITGALYSVSKLAKRQE